MNVNINEDTNVLRIEEQNRISLFPIRVSTRGIWKQEKESDKR